LELYKKLLLENKEYLALNVYVSLCYYKLDFFDIAEEILNHYLAERPDSIIAVNLKACIKFQLYQGQAAENELRSLQSIYTGGDIFQDFDLFRHNLVVFRGGENAL
jgi:intraflagellar transport protein 56